MKQLNQDIVNIVPVKELDEKSKEYLFSILSANFFNHNFGSMSKSEFELAVFYAYYSSFVRANKDSQFYHDYYDISNTLGISESKVRNLIEKSKLRYGYKELFDAEYSDSWINQLAECLKRGEYNAEENLFIMPIYDPSLYSQIEHYLFVHGKMNQNTILTNKRFSMNVRDALELFCNKDMALINTEIELARKKIKDAAFANAIAEYLLKPTITSLASLITDSPRSIVKSLVELLPEDGKFNLLLKKICK